ncbi:hypothetical protein ACHAWT_009461 [Skeletonema menzelii]
MSKRMKKLKNITRIFVVALQLQIASSLEKRLETNYNGNLHADGSIFEVVSKGQQLSITSLDVNMDAGTDTVSVYARPGNLVASNDGGWLLIKSFEITGQGRGVVTSLPDFDSPIIVPAGFKQSFYIETNSTDIDFWYGDGTELGTVLSSNDDLSVLEGYAIGHAWRGFAAPRQWNGAVHYSVAANVPTASPVLGPTSSPSSSAAPSLKPSTYPSLLPTSGFVSPPTVDDTTTQSPTKRPSKKPTPQPTQPQPTMSPAPTMTDFKEPRSITPRPTEAPVSSSRRMSYSAWTAIACLSLAITNMWL